MAERAVATTKTPETKQKCSNSCKQNIGFNSSGSPADRILQFQRTAGNQAVQKLIKSRALQAKLKIGQPNDIYEQEADRVAEQVMRKPEKKVSNETKVSNPARNNSIQRKCPGCNKGTKIGKEEEEEKLLKKEASGPTPEATSELESSINAVRRGGQPLPESVRAFYEPRFGEDFGGVKVHTDAKAGEAAQMMGARAFTAGRDIMFGSGQFALGTNEGQRLMAHELTHVVQQKSALRMNSGKTINLTVEKNTQIPLQIQNLSSSEMLQCSLLSEELKEIWSIEGKGVFFDRLRHAGQTDPDVIKFIEENLTGDYLWLARNIFLYGIEADWPIHLRVEREMKGWSDSGGKGSVFEILRKTNGKEAGNAILIASVDHVFAVGSDDLWLAQNLQAYGPEPNWPMSADEIKVKFPKFPSVSEALVILKRAEIEKAKAGIAYQSDEEKKTKVGLAISVLERTRKYKVDPKTYRVDFVQTAGKQVEITTIEDFILFVEQVERQYPSATASEIASEVRQLWFSDENWEILVSSEGIKEGGKTLDIETAPNPIATRINMRTLAPRSGGKMLSTPLGKVDIGHVMAGIDAALSSFPSSYPKDYLASQGHDTGDSKLKYETLKAASGGDSRDFTTWAGDIGQAYAEYLVELYVKKKNARLSTFISEKAPSTALLGDIHGYIAVEMSKEISKVVSRASLKVSKVLRDLYLVRGKSQKTYRQYVEKVSGKSDFALRQFIVDRAKAFARPWFAKKAYEARRWWKSKGWSAEGVLDSGMEEFDRVHVEHEGKAAKGEKLDKVVDEFITIIESKIK